MTKQQKTYYGFDRPDLQQQDSEKHQAVLREGAGWCMKPGVARAKSLT